MLSLCFGSIFCHVRKCLSIDDDSKLCNHGVKSLTLKYHGCQSWAEVVFPQCWKRWHFTEKRSVVFILRNSRAVVSPAFPDWKSTKFKSSPPRKPHFLFKTHQRCHQRSPKKYYKLFQALEYQVTLKNTSGSYFRVCVAPVFCMYPLRTFNFMLFIPPSIAAQLMVDCSDAASPPQLTLKAHVLPQRTYWWSIQCTVWVYAIHASTLTKDNICNLWTSCRLWLLSVRFHQVQVEFPTVHKHA